MEQFRVSTNCVRFADSEFMYSDDGRKLEESVDTFIVFRLKGCRFTVGTAFSGVKQAK